MRFLEKVRIETEDYLEKTFAMTYEELRAASHSKRQEAIEKYGEKIIEITHNLDDLDVEKLRLKAQLERYKKQRLELQQKRNE